MAATVQFGQREKATGHPKMLSSDVLVQKGSDITVNHDNAFRSSNYNLFLLHSDLWQF